MVEPLLAALSALYLGLALTFSVLQQRHARRHAGSARRADRDRRPRTTWPSVDMVVPAYNEDPGLLAACCRSIEAQDYPGELRVFLVDDGSRNRDALSEVYRRYEGRPGWAVTMLGDNRGKRYAQDAAVRAGRGALVVTIDSDTVLAPDGIRRLVAAFDDERVGAVTGDVRVSNAGDNRLTRLIDERYRLLFEQERAAQSHLGAVLCCAGPFSAYRRAALDEVWGDYLGQTFLGRPCVAGDDLHLTNLVLAHGYRSVYLPEARALTHVPTTLRRYVRQQVRWNRSFYRELGSTLRVLPGRHAYLKLDLAARLLLPLLLAAGIALAAGAVVVEAAAGDGGPRRPVAAAAMVIAMTLASAGLLASKSPRPRFVLLYGLIYVGLLIPTRLWALLTLRENHWGTRRARDLGDALAPHSLSAATPR